MAPRIGYTHTPRIGYTLDVLQHLHPGACGTDVKLVWTKDNEWQMEWFDPKNGRIVPLPHFCGVRELRLFAQQLLAFADERERACEPDPHEVIL